MKTKVIGENDYYARIKALNISHYAGEVAYYKQASLRGVEKKLLSSIHKGSKILDVGCGSGVHMKLLAPRVRTVAGIDSSRQMLIFARRTLTRSAKKNWRLIHADASAIPFPPHTFDCIIAMGLLDYVTSPLQVLRECRRVMTARGVLVASMPKKPSIFSLLRSPVGDSIKRGIFHLPPVDHAVTKKELLLLFQTVGFRVVTLTSVWSAMWMVKARL